MMAEIKNKETQADWEVIPLGEVFKLTSGKTKPNELFDEPFEDNIYPVFGGNGIMGFASEFNSEGENILIGRVGEYCGITRYVNEKCWITDNALYTREFLKDVDSKFLAYKLQLEDLSRLRNKGGQPLISQGPIGIHKIFLPKSLPEQKAIAQVLRTADAAIQTTEKLIAQKELRKKWLMQQLLTGKKRLKGFDGDWKFVRFKEIYSQVKQKAGDEKFLVLSVTKDGIVSQAEYFNKEIASEDTSPYLVVRKGDMAMSGLNFWMGSIDVLVEYEIGMVSPAYKVFEIHNPEISATFMKSFVRSEIMLQCLIGSSVVGASIVRRNLDRETLDEWSFRLPLLEEQTAIAQVLQAADKEISLLKAKAEKLREQKKGLMQVLLTGKVRLKI